MFKVALCFWGLLRSLQYTLPSIEKFVLHPLKFHHIEYDIFIHTYKFRGKYENIRNGEQATQLNFTEYALLNPNYVYLEDQNDFDENFSYTNFTTHGDPWKNDYVSLKNHVRALNSLYHLAKVVELVGGYKTAGKGVYDYIIFLRPDVQYLAPIPIFLAKEYPDHVFLPDFHKVCDNGQTNPLSEYNDRLLMGPPHLALPCFGSKLAYAYNYSLHSSLHSERLTYHTLSHCVWALHNQTRYPEHLPFVPPPPSLKNHKKHQKHTPSGHSSHSTHSSHDRRYISPPSPPPYILELPYRFRRIRATGDVDRRDETLHPPPDLCVLDGDKQKVVINGKPVNSFQYLSNWIFGSHRDEEGKKKEVCMCPTRPVLTPTTLHTLQFKYAKLPYRGLSYPHTHISGSTNSTSAMADGINSHGMRGGMGKNKGGRGSKQVHCEYIYVRGRDMGMPDKLTLLTPSECSFAP